MSERIDRRSAFLLVAAAVADGMSVPRSIRFTDHDSDGTLSVDPFSAAEGREWLVWFGVPAEKITISKSRMEPDGKRRAYLNAPYTEWNGWAISVFFGEEVPPPAAPAVGEAADKIRAAVAQVQVPGGAR